jgi:hypothetical protein
MSPPGDQVSTRLDIHAQTIHTHILTFPFGANREPRGLAMASVQTPAATLDDLARVTDKAELIDGRIELLMPTGIFA